MIPGQPVTVIPPPVVLTPTVVGQPMTAQVNNPQDALRRAQEQAQVRQIDILTDFLYMLWYLKIGQDCFLSYSHCTGSY
jgi:hypothetical protein